MRFVRRLYIAAALTYVLLGVLFCAAAFAAPRSTLAPSPSQTWLTPPSGSSDAIVQRYFDYLALQDLGHLGQTSTSMNWVGWMDALSFGGAFLVVLYFFIYAWFARRKNGDLYPVEVYNGYITERNGSIDAFNIALYAVVAIYGVLYIVMSLRFGQLY